MDGARGLHVPLGHYRWIQGLHRDVGGAAGGAVRDLAELGSRRPVGDRMPTVEGPPGTSSQAGCLFNHRRVRGEFGGTPLTEQDTNLINLITTINDHEQRFSTQART
mgnify:CR=1 FL=1